MRPGTLIALVVALALTPAAASASDRTQVTLAVREAMQLAVERGVAAIARSDGFLGSPAIRVAVPEQLERLEAALRMAGQDRLTDKFVVSLNRAAEQAALVARAPLLIAASEIGSDDAQRVLAGGDNAGTELLRRHAVGRAIAALNPAVAEAMDRAGAARRYKRFVKGAQFGGLVRETPIDLEAYVVGRTLDGLFHAIAQEERRIRVDPAARTTPRLREVFGAQR